MDFGGTESSPGSDAARLRAVSRAGAYSDESGSLLVNAEPGVVGEVGGPLHGHTETIFGDMVDVGFDAINAQLFTMEIEGLARAHRGRVTFWGEIDRRRVLAFGTPEEVRAAIERRGTEAA